MRIIETFVPLYLSNKCDGYCRICNMRKSNKRLNRITGTYDKITEQLNIIYNIEKIKAVCFLTGEYNYGQERNENFSLIIWSIEEAIKFGFEKIYINIGALSDLEISQLFSLFGSKQNILVLSLFQETYDIITYKKHFEDFNKLHPKSDFKNRLSTPERWIDNGFTNLDLGILVGLFDFKSDLIALINHAKQLFELGGNISISLPRIKGINNPRFLVPDSTYRNSIINLSKQEHWLKLIITTRETDLFIKSILEYIHIVSPGTSDVLPYTKYGDIPNDINTSQFQVAKRRKRPSDVLKELNFKHIKYYQNE